MGALGLERALRTPFPTAAYFLNQAQPLFPPALRVNGDRVAFVHHEYEPYRRISRVSVLDSSADPLTLSTTTDALFADELLLTTDFVYAPDFRGISAIPTGVPPAAAVLVDFGYEEQLDVLLLGTGQAALVIDVEGRRELVLTASNGVERVRIELPGTAERLLPVGDHVAVLLEREGSTGCEQSGGVDCDEHGLWLVDPRDTPEVVGTAEWPLATFESSRGTSAFGSYMHAPLRLANGDWVFLQEESVTCVLIAECNALGIAARPLSEAKLAFAMPAPCPDSVEDCPHPAGARSVRKKRSCEFVSPRRERPKSSKVRRARKLGTRTPGIVVCRTPRGGQLGAAHTPRATVVGCHCAIHVGARRRHGRRRTRRRRVAQRPGLRHRYGGREDSLHGRTPATR
jgi:hypothetical protein